MSTALVWLVVAFAICLALAGFPADAREVVQPCSMPAGWTRLGRPDERVVPTSGGGTRITGEVSAVATSWQRHGRWYVGGVQGVYQTDDCGATWQHIFSVVPAADVATLVTALASDPAGRLFVARYPSITISKLLYVTEDEGRTWLPIRVETRGDIVVLPGGLQGSAAGRVYLRSTRREMLAGRTGFGYTDDGGQSWVMRWGQAGPSAFAADPFDRDTIYAVGRLVHQRPAPQPTPGVPVDRIPHPPPYQLTKSVDGGASFAPWSSVDELPGALAVSTDGSRFWFASYSQHLWRSLDGGASWQVIAEMPFANPRQLLADSSDPRTLFAISGDGYLWVFQEPEGVAVNGADCTIPVNGGRRPSAVQIPAHSPTSCE